jgi:regulator of RNase E activity RraA
MGGSSIGNGAAPSLTSTAVSDAMERIGLDGVLSGLVAYGDSVVVGAAFTVRLCEPERSERPFNAYLDELSAGSVVVIDSGGLRGFSVWGGLMSAEARRRGAVGAVVRGEVRDVAQARQMRFGLFALGLTPRSGRPLARLESTGVSIDWDGTAVEPGDTVVADEDGVVVVPARHAQTVIDVAAEIEASDAALLQQVDSGISLAMARESLARGNRA